MSSTFSALTLVVIALLFHLAGVLDLPVVAWVVLGVAVASGVAVDVTRAVVGRRPA